VYSTALAHPAASVLCLTTITACNNIDFALIGQAERIATFPREGDWRGSWTEERSEYYIGGDEMGDHGIEFSVTVHSQQAQQQN
jgi:hypothetical protein